MPIDYLILKSWILIIKINLCIKAVKLNNVSIQVRDVTQRLWRTERSKIGGQVMMSNNLGINREKVELSRRNECGDQGGNGKRHDDSICPL